MNYFYKFDHSFSTPNTSGGGKISVFITTLDNFVDLGWIPNLEATNHCTPSISNIQDRVEYTGSGQVFIDNGTELNIENTSKSFFNTNNAIFHLKNILHIPSNIVIL